MVFIEPSQSVGKTLWTILDTGITKDPKLWMQFPKASSWVYVLLRENVGFYGMECLFWTCNNTGGSPELSVEFLQMVNQTSAVPI